MAPRRFARGGALMRARDRIRQLAEAAGVGLFLAALVAATASGAWAMGTLRPASSLAPSKLATLDPADAAVLAAHVAAADGDVDRIAAVIPEVAGSPLESYVAYWLASARLRGVEPDDSLAVAFLARYPGTVLAERLRGEWMQLLATRGDFAAFEAERHRLVFAPDDPQLVCDGLLARYALDDGHKREQIARDARRALASSTDPGGDGCTALADRLMQDGALAVWARLQALVERNQLPVAQRTVAQQLGVQEAASVKRLLEHPDTWLSAAPSLDRLPRPMVLLAIVALARDAPEAAARHAERLDAGFTAEERATIWGRIGRMGLLALHGQAHEWFERGGDLVGAIPECVRANDVLEARARAALRRGAVPGAANLSTAPVGPDWPALRRAIAHMPPEMQAESTWAYWNAQALLALGHREEGNAALHALADRFSFYGRLAAESLGIAPALPARPTPATDVLVDELATRTGLERAHRLINLGLRDEGNREWSWELRGLDDATLHAAAELARRWGVLDRMIATSERMHAIVDIEQRYPMPHTELMEETTASLAMDPAWVYGLIRQESRFVEDVRSNAGAVGLMQLMPQTARYVAHRIGLKNFSAERIVEAGVNLRLGTEYLKLVLEDQDNQPLLASAAYNAGPTRVRKWRLPLARPLDGALFLETIPISETRDYVKRVLFNTVVYGTLLKRPGISLRAMLGPVAPKIGPPSDLP
jgi:soluble lytic murein transglycosylase